MPQEVRRVIRAGIEASGSTKRTVGREENPRSSTGGGLDDHWDSYSGRDLLEEREISPRDVER